MYAMYMYMYVIVTYTLYIIIHFVCTCTCYSDCSCVRATISTSLINRFDYTANADLLNNS